MLRAVFSTRLLSTPLLLGLLVLPLRAIGFFFAPAAADCHVVLPAHAL